MTDSQASSTTAASGSRVGTNPVAAAPAHARTAADVVTPEVVAQLTRDVVGSGRTANHSPFTGEKLADLPESTPEDVEAAFGRARAAQPAWAATPVRARAAVLLRFHDLVLQRQSEVLDLIQLETGKARLHAHEEVQAVAVAARHYGRRAASYLKPRRHTGVVPTLTKVTELRQPRGVVGQIAPWNYPLELSVGDALPAFVSGNAVVMKPDTETALTALWARDLLIEAGLPAEVFQVVIGEGPVVGPAVVSRADYVSFTGSTRTGREVAQGAAARLVGVSLELGGKNAMLVLEDADVERAAEGAVRACFSSAGQLCISIERLYVHESVADAFVERFAARTKAMRLGSSLAYGADMGSLVGERQLETVSRHVAEAVEKGATLVAGGVARPDIGPLFYEPTILDGVEAPMAVCGEETFGPVVSIYRFGDDDEAVTLANATPYGLNSSVWTKNAGRGHRVAARLRTGTVNINEGYAPAYGSVQSPMGGMKDSGLGRRHGSEGILKYTEAQTVAQQRLMPLAPAFGMDDEKYAAFMTRSLKAMKAFRLR
ncbi:succinic semialdehyde dehydrogenase [[Kitasatospora] papulosa]|jgi:succinate-semialdehyde dehydrogenase/glutarate-semialdehyde dehydrogenase|uniref:succinate-semialdehyde dehydrogenase (NADP(+)) n=1 Tax=Streptomyces pratensis (strain ATCC 33331 / IAF-45CD) TaxID=591167 RepID=A0A8D3WJY1_STRFA|nr:MULTISPECIES: succinic semialdehyde dehydrogenase [Streptomyces]MDF9870587.1 succinate-semialdehyde dehydrogenase/glutarate-semialdehyde dehydrogenase [Streptomyces pratensis]TPN19783.1 succinate-semialdehyde dehydrogenase (NADP(+)) [Mesorhizobium sp. B2-3-3]AGJ56787.1 aldehyde dehydrogenase [Streptomyces sp. PAMC 26508]MCX4415145.1 succinic semialdehyde dehydrogenase [[Kitasatospora] papulosa]MDX2621997.1 succinic semialdehyde dehydrogenase [Streptomyces sp. WI03-5b]